ncbi:hypothetical protein ACFQS1_19675 [Paractinoplanes rhizophilus]|uniref:Uncharacterized protein n=1 Tax=Paractinoplanes rhizophilus TaxID=1416877 RepID=A0ABW2HSS7_9ACTN
MTVRGHQLAIDWSQQGTFANALEDASSYALAGDIEVSWGRDVSGENTLKSTAGQLLFSLNNEGQLFSPENSSSPIAGKILPNRPVRYQVTNGGVTYTLLSGQLDDFDVSGDPVGVFSGTALDGWGQPGSATLSTPLYRGIRTGDAIGYVLDEIGWTGGRDIDPGATYMPWWWEEGTDADTAITKLVHSEGPPAIAYVEGGTFVFKDRHHRIFDARSTTSQGTYTHTIPAGAVAGDFKIEAGSFVYDHGAKRIANSATFSVDLRAPQKIAEVWTQDDLLTVAAGDTLRLIVQTTGPFLGAVVPSVESGDIQLQSGAVSSVTLSRTSGQSAILSITCSGASVITRVAVRASPVSVVRTVQVSAQDTGSIGHFGIQQWPDDAAPTWANQYDAQAIATKIVAVYANYRPTITFSVVGLDATYLAEILASRISDRITVRNDARGINADFMIERLKHRITSLGVVHRLEITCQAAEPTQPANLFTFGVAGKGFNQGLFGVEGIDNASNVFRFDVAGQGFDQGSFAN